MKGPIPFTGTVQYLAGTKVVRTYPVGWTHFQLIDPFLMQTLIFGWDVVSRCGNVRLTPDGMLRINPGFVYDGCSGIPDRLLKRLKKLMRGATAHDGVYRLLQHGVFGKDPEVTASIKALGDQLMVDIWKADKVIAPARAFGSWMMHRKVARDAAAPRADEIIVFP